MNDGRRGAVLCAWDRSLLPASYRDGSPCPASSWFALKPIRPMLCLFFFLFFFASCMAPWSSCCRILRYYVFYCCLCVFLRFIDEFIYSVEAGYYCLVKYTSSSASVGFFSLLFVFLSIYSLCRVFFFFFVKFIAYVECIDF